MRRILLLAGANIRRAKLQMGILAILFLIAAMLMNVGFALLFNFGNYFDEMAEDLNTSDALIVISQNLWSEESEAYLRSQVTEYEKHSVVLLMGEIPWGDNIVNQAFMFSDVAEVRNFSQWKLVGDYEPLSANGVYIPFGMNIHGHELGNDFTIATDQGDFTFVIDGHTESILSDGVNTFANLFVPTTQFQMLYDQFSNYRAYLFFANGVANVSGLLFELDVIAGSVASGLSPDLVMAGITLESISMFRTMMANMTAMIMVLFTLIIALVSLFVVRFRIKNSLEEDIGRIGSLKAIGYESKQVIRSVILQYGVVIFIASVLAIVPTIFILPAIGNVLASQSGIFWQPGITPEFYALTTVILVLIVWLGTKISARGIKKITPVAALRGESIANQKTKRNRILLSKTKLPLIPALAGKSVFQGFRQSLMMFFIMLAVSLTGMISLVIFYNATIDLSAFELIPGNERANSAIALRPEVDHRALQAEVIALPDVRDAQFHDFMFTIANEEFVSISVMDDFDRRVTRNIHRGSFPRTAYEVAISGIGANLFGTEIGDVIYIGTTEAPFTVSGIFSGMAEVAMLTAEGALRANPDFTQNVLFIYLYRGTDAAIFTENLGIQFAAESFMVINGDAEFEEGAGIFASILSMVGIVILIIAICVIMLILYLVIGATIIRRHRELGIQKAIGYTTGELMRQISMAFSLPVVLGTVSGVVLGIFFAGDLLNVAMRPMGVLAANLLVNNVWLLAAGGILVVLAIGLSLLVTWRIRKISAYKLVTE
ncbi:MAG: FtsX-like permease family protein [Defluviitaleaceae bacterium]|nr:FtsX-like permease family protein [Defluviitaleaceae bacterium]